MEGGSSADAAAEAAAARERRNARAGVSDAKKRALEEKLAAVRAREARPVPPVPPPPAGLEEVRLDVSGSYSAPRERAESESDPDDTPDVQERDQKPVVDWVSPPQAEIARVSRLYARPTYVMQTMHPPVEFWLEPDDPPDHGLHLQAGGAIANVSDGSMAAANGVTVTHTLVKVGSTRIAAGMSAAEITALVEARPVLLKFKGGPMETPQRLVFDKADAKLDAKGWPTEETISGQKPKPYPCCRLDVDELGTIGGIGMRLYFYLLHFLCGAFFVMAVLTTPSIILMKNDDMYNHSEAARYRTALAETTLGNVKSPLEELQNGALLSHKLWTISGVEALGSLIMLVMVLRASKQMARLVEDVDRAAVTMGDYTVVVEPQSPWDEYKSVGKAKRQQLLDDLERALEQAVPNAELAEIEGQACIWIGWDDRHNIGLWNGKRELMLKLEAALGVAYTSGGDTTAAEKILGELDVLNKELRMMNTICAWRPVYVFATYNLAEHYEDALNVKEVEVGGVKCTIRKAPEPETVKWEHLEFTATQRKWRKRKIYLGTFLALMIGAAVIGYANSLKVGTKYIAFCVDVIGDESKTELDDACPGARDDVAGDGIAWTPGGASDLAALYHNMYKAVHDTDGDLYVAEEGDDGPETVGTVEDDLPFAVCPDGERGTEGQPCHYIDTGLSDTTAYLMPRGDLDAMCYACICTLSSVADTMRQPLEDHLTENPTYLDQCYAESAATSFATASDAEATATVAACAAADLSDPETAEAKCEGAGDCTYHKSDVGSYCEEMDAVVAEASLWGNIATAIVVVINQVLKQGMKRSASYARAHTIEEEMVATSMRVYACQLLNTAILMLILRSDFWVFHTLPGEHYPTVNAKWYAEVGAPLIQTMVIQFVTPPSIQIFTIFLKKCLAKRAAKKASTQNQLNASQAPYGFEVAAGYGEVLLAASVTMIFGSGIPLLYHVAAVGFFVRANLEKWIIVNVTRKPPLYSKKLFESFDELFAVLLLVHVAMATYFMASAGGLTPTSTHIYLDELFLHSDTPMHHHIWPVLGVTALVLLGVSCKFLCKLKCCSRPKKAGGDAVPEVIPSFAEAYAAGLIINEDDDYVMDSYEELMDLEEAFKKALDEAYEQQQVPFDPENEAFYRRTRAAVGAVLGENWIQGHTDKGANTQKNAVGAKEKARVEAEVMDRHKRVKAPLPFRPGGVPAGERVTVFT